MLLDMHENRKIQDILYTDRKVRRSFIKIYILIDILINRNEY